MKLTLKKITGAKSLKETLYLITREGVPVGLINHFANTRTETHPWRLFLYSGEFVPGETEAKMVTVCYGKPAAEARRELLRIAGEELEKTECAKST